MVERLASLPAIRRRSRPTRSAPCSAELRREATRRGGRAPAPGAGARRAQGRSSGPGRGRTSTSSSRRATSTTTWSRRCAAAQAGADVIAVIRSTAQSLLDYVPDGATTEGYGGTYATQENFRIMREALDEESRTPRPLRAPDELLLRPVHAGDRVRGGVGAARHAPQRRDVRDPLPRHQHEADPVRPALLAADLRARRDRHQHRRGQLHHDRRRGRGGAHRHRVAVRERELRAPRRTARPAHRARPLRSRSTRPARTPSPGSSPRRSSSARSSPTRPSSTCPRPSTSRGTSSSATPTT